MTVQMTSFNPMAFDAIHDDLAFIFSEVNKYSDPKLPSPEKNESLRVHCSESNFPFLNGVLQTQDSIEDPNATIDKQVNYFKTQNKAHIWWLKNESQLKQMTPFLEKAGYEFMGNFVGYAQNLEYFDDSTSLKLPKGFEVLEVQNTDQYQKFIEVFAKVFEMDQAACQIYDKMMGTYGPHKTFRHFVALDGDQVIGVITALMRNGWCGVWNGGVLKEYRKKGIGRLLSKAILDLGRAENAKGFTTLLVASAMAMPLVRKFHGKAVGTVYPFIKTP